MSGAGKIRYLRRVPGRDGGGEGNMFPRFRSFPRFLCL